jgi:hypothetical protein
VSSIKGCLGSKVLVPGVQLPLRVAPQGIPTPDKTGSNRYISRSQ